MRHIVKQTAHRHHQWFNRKQRLIKPPVSVYSAGSAGIWRAGLREIVTLTGMVLVSSPLKEYDKRIEILTREQGRIPAFAQGASLYSIRKI